MKLKGVDHLAFVVTDLERSVKFYQEVFDGEAGRSRGLNEQDKAANRSRHTLAENMESFRSCTLLRHIAVLGLDGSC